MKAKNLEQVLNHFVTPGILSGQELRLWFVDRDPSIRKRIALDLKQRSWDEPGKALFIGHRGSGKSTELNQLATEIERDFYVIRFDAYETIGRTNLEYEDLMLTLIGQVTQACISEAFIAKPLSDSFRVVLTDLGDWWKKFVAGRIKVPAGEVELAVQLKTIVGQVEAGLKHSSQTREEYKLRVSAELPELIRQLNLTVEEAQKAINKRLLVVIEGTDKIDFEAARQLFGGHAATITAPRLALIYTAPISLRSSGLLESLRADFPIRRVLPNIPAYNRDQSANAKGRDLLKEVVINRMESRLISNDALDLLIEKNGGTLYVLVYLVRSATLYALTTGNNKTIGLEDAKSAVLEYRNEILAPSLTRQDWQVLKKRHQDKVVDAEPENVRLLHIGALVEYTNGENWCDAHPALWELLDDPEEQE